MEGLHPWTLLRSTANGGTLDWLEWGLNLGGVRLHQTAVDALQTAGSGQALMRDLGAASGDNAGRGCKGDPGSACAENAAGSGKSPSDTTFSLLVSFGTFLWQ